MSTSFLGLGQPLSDPVCEDGSPMKTTVQLDYRAILANTARPVHLAFQFTAPPATVRRQQPIAFSLVVDRSGSMEGPPLAAAIRAAKTVVQNLRQEDWFSLVAFDDSAEVVIPIGPVRSKQQICERIDRIETGGSTNLTGGWTLGRDALRQAPASAIRRQMLLTDGQLNVGIVDPHQVRQIVSHGLERDGIRTSTLGFGDDYDEDLLASLAQATNGAFYDANDPEKLPAIFGAELDGLQQVAVQNLRLRFKPLDFVDDCLSLGGYNQVKLPDGRIEYAIGDLMTEEDRVAVFVLSVLPMPLLAGTATPAATLEGEAIAEVEILYDAISADGIASRSEVHTIRVRATQDPAEVQVNEDALPWVSAQQAAEIMEKALQRRDQGDLPGAQKLLQDGIAHLNAYASDAKVADGLQLLKKALHEITETTDYVRSRKELKFMRASYARMSSADEWVAEEQAKPSFKKPRPRRPADDADATPPANPRPQS